MRVKSEPAQLREFSRNYSVQPRMDTNGHEYGEPKTGLLAERVWSPSGECRRPGSSREMINLIRVNSLFSVVFYCMGGRKIDDSKNIPVHSEIIFLPSIFLPPSADAFYSTNSSIPNFFNV